jgi:hypothetical protein
MTRRVMSLAAVALVTALTAGCGGGGKTTAADEWASGFCGDSTELLVFLVDARDGTKGGAVVPKDAARVIDFRTGIFRDELDKLGRPDTPQGKASRDLAKAYAKAAQEHADAISSAAKGDGSMEEQKQTVEREATASLQDMKATASSIGRQDADLGITTNPDCAELRAELQKHLTR